MAKNDLVTIARGTALRPALAIGIGVPRQLVFLNRTIGQVITRGWECLGMLPKWPKGSDCKSDCFAFGGSNPSHATKDGPVISKITGLLGLLGVWPPRNPQLVLNE